MMATVARALSQWSVALYLLLVVALASVLYWQFRAGAQAEQALKDENRVLEQRIEEDQALLARQRNIVIARLREGTPLHLSNVRWVMPLDDESMTEIRQGLFSQLQDPRKQVRAHGLSGVRSLVLCGGQITPVHPEIVQSLIPLLHEPDLRTATLMVIRDIGESAEPAIPDMLATVPKHNWSNVRVTIQIVRRIDPHFDLVPFLVEYLLAEDVSKTASGSQLSQIVPRADLLSAAQKVVALAPATPQGKHASQIIQYVEFLPPESKYPVLEKPRTNSSGAIIP